MEIPTTWGTKQAPDNYTPRPEVHSFDKFVDTHVQCANIPDQSANTSSRPPVGPLNTPGNKSGLLGSAPVSASPL
jgi:hypothetical protein